MVKWDTSILHQRYTDRDSQSRNPTYRWYAMHTFNSTHIYLEAYTC